MHLFWGDTYERIRANMAEIRGLVASGARVDGFQKILAPMEDIFVRVVKEDEA